jgi:hypothetical protein
LHDTFRRRALPNQVDYSRDAAHDSRPNRLTVLTTCSGQFDEIGLEQGKLVGTHTAISIAEDAEEKSWQMSGDERS